MKKICVAALICLTLAGPGYAFEDGDFQVWHTEDQDFKIDKVSKVTLEEEFRFGNNVTDFFYQHYDVGFVYSVANNLDLGLNYRQIYEKERGKFRPENRPYANATMKYEFWGFNVEDRNRVEYRHFDYKSDSWRYRNRITIKFPWKFSKFAMRPYLSDDVTTVLNNGTISRNRAYFGFEFSLFRNMKGDIYYMLQNNRSADGWICANVVGTKIKLSF
ncbi:MAG: DUF2490 domain-containing protein [Candidatus Omnitrophica bacterium]|nr:DUF2490 domain-containing protein [Candidatus Omnitrophota bacterium]